MPSIGAPLCAADFMLGFGGLWAAWVFVNRLWVLYSNIGRASDIDLGFNSFFTFTFAVYQIVLLIQLSRLLMRWDIRRAADCMLYAWAWVFFHAAAITLYLDHTSAKHRGFSFAFKHAGLTFVVENGFMFVLAGVIAAVRHVRAKIDEERR